MPKSPEGGYVPSPEEVKKAEEMMTAEEKESTADRIKSRESRERLVADPTKIKYEVLVPKIGGGVKFDDGREYEVREKTEEKEKYQYKNMAICEALNKGAKFWVEFNSGGDKNLVDTESAFYALVELDGGHEKMPFPILEQAIGERLFDQTFMKEEVVASADGAYVTNEKEGKRKEFESWLRKKFGKQFLGTKDKSFS